ncbi:MAG: hypothetical protein ISS49_02270 [Anaerolineae bacterium]|nr:hypothetical protein [Anaerolineae bacterium]
MALVKHYKELRVYQQAFAAKLVHWYIGKLVNWVTETHYQFPGFPIYQFPNPNAWCGPSKLREPTAPYYAHTPIPSHTPTPPYSDAGTDEQ